MMSFLVAGCVSTEAEPLVDDAIVRAVTAREAAVPFEDGRLVRWNADVRRARTAVDVAEARARSAGWPGPIAVGVVSPDPTAPREGTQFNATFDLLGALGLGPAREELVVAVAEVDRARAALAEVERRARFAIFSAGVRWNAAHARRRVLEDFLSETAVGAARIVALRRVGRVGEGVAGRVDANLAGIEARVRETRIVEAAARSAFARLAGLDVASLTAAPPEVAAAPAFRLDDATDPHRLLASHPRLATARADYAVAEARLRRVAAETWPRLRVGPRLTLAPDRLIPGGVISLEIPVPGSLDGEIEAAAVNRADARRRLEDGLVILMAEVEARRVEYEETGAIFEGEAAARDRGSREAWRAANAILSVKEGLGPVETWLDALQLRVGGIVALIDAGERLRLAELALRDASGEAPHGEGP